MELVEPPVGYEVQESRAQGRHGPQKELVTQGPVQLVMPCVLPTGGHGCGRLTNTQVYRAWPDKANHPDLAGRARSAVQVTL